MKITMFLAVGTFFVLLVTSAQKADYPKVELLEQRNTPSTQELIEQTELYRQTVTIHDTLNEASRLAKEIRDEKAN